MNGSALSPFPCPPDERTLTRLVLPVRRSWTKTSLLWFVSPRTRLEASDQKAMNRRARRASAAGCRLCLSATAANAQPLDLPVLRSRPKTSKLPFVSPLARLEALDSNATKRPCSRGRARELRPGLTAMRTETHPVRLGGAHRLQGWRRKGHQAARQQQGSPCIADSAAHRAGSPRSTRRWRR